MSTTEQRRAANRANAQSSTGPASIKGKEIASRNSTRHGLLSAKLFLDDEDPAEFDRLLGDLLRSLAPLGSIEMVLVERIAVTIWRQRRLVHAETAGLSLARQAKKVAGAVSSELSRGYGSEIEQDDLAPFDADTEAWSHSALAEIEALDEIDMRSLEQKAPLIFEQLQSDAEEDGEEPAAYAGAHKGGLTGYINELTLWCHRQLMEAEARPHVLALAEQVRAKRLILPADTLELLARYQTTLDNHLYKALKALREAQEWRLKTLEASPQAVELDQVGHADDA
jgi:hypothetical protein